MGQEAAEASSGQRWQEVPQIGPGSAALKATGGRMSVVVVAAEVAPWSKQGGLGDVAGSLPAALAQQGHRVMAVSPMYRNAGKRENWEMLQDLQTPVWLPLQYGEGGHRADFFHHSVDGVDWVFVSHPCFDRPGLYGENGADYGDNLFRFALLSMAACEAPLCLPLPATAQGSEGAAYGEEVVFLVNDWHTALVPVLLQGKYRPHGVFRHAACTLAVHNLAHQGIYAPPEFSVLGLPESFYPDLDWVYIDADPPPGQPAEYQVMNVLKGGLATSDCIVTVSQGYAADITAGKQLPYGDQVASCGLAPLLQQRAGDLVGITNGIDTELWDPTTDAYLPFTYSAVALEGKARCKVSLQRELGLPAAPLRPLLAFIGRLDYQKGPDIVLDAVPALSAMDCQVVMLGSGAADYEHHMAHLQREFADSFRAVVGFREELAHKIIAGADILLMPSRFEPCGLTQLQAMRYGTIPVAHAAGGLRDTIDPVYPFLSDLQPGKGPPPGTGWLFPRLQPQRLVDAVREAIGIYLDDPEAWHSIMRHAMAQDRSWTAAARQYERVLATAAASAHPAAAAEP